MKEQVILIHGFGVDPNWHWYTWIEEQLTNLGYGVKVPKMPNSLKPDVAEWVQTIMEQVEDPESTILCGHSLGGLAILLYLNIYGGRPFKKVFFISTPIAIIENEKLELVREFLNASADIDWAGIREVGREFVVLHGEEDFVVPVDQGKELAKELGVTCRLLDGGHFLQDTFPELLNYFTPSAR